MITYNYACINDDCKVSGIIPVRKEEELEDRVEHCYGCDKPLKQMGYVCNVAIRGDIQSRMLRNQEHFRRRAKKHAASEEQQVLKRERQDQEFKTMGLHKKK